MQSIWTLGRHLTMSQMIGLSRELRHRGSKGSYLIRLKVGLVTGGRGLWCTGVGLVTGGRRLWWTGASHWKSLTCDESV